VFQSVELSISITPKISPESAQDDHGSGERHQRSAVAHGVQSLHRHVIRVLKWKHKVSEENVKWCSVMQLQTAVEVVNSPGGCCFLHQTCRHRRSGGRSQTSRTLCSFGSPSPVLWTHNTSCYCSKQSHISSENRK